MLRLIAYLILLAPVTYGALWLAEHPGNVVIEWQGYEIRMALGILAGLVTFGTVIILTTVLIIRSLLYTPERMRQKRKLRNYEQGLQAISQTMTALALADHKEAERQLRKSRHYLKSEQPVTHLLGVQLAHATGAADTARAEFDAMLENPQTRQVALRGKIMELMRAGETVHARDHAEEAWSKRPHDAWLCQLLLDILFREKDWTAIDPIIATATRKGSLSREQSAHYHAMLHLARAREASAKEEWPRALELAQLALKHQDKLLPARLMVASILARQSELKPLLRFLEQSWSSEPHPDFAQLFLSHACDESVNKTHKRLQRMVDKHPDHLETLLLQASVFIHLSEWDKARNALKVSLSKGESPRIYQMLSQVEIGETGDDKQAAHWLNQAVNAPKDMHWTCAHCGELHEQWQTHCQHCGQFDQINWMLPDQYRDRDTQLLKA